MTILRSQDAPPEAPRGSAFSQAWADLSLRTKLLAFALALVTLPGIVFALFAFSGARAALEREVGIQLHQTAERGADALAAALARAHSDARSWANQDIMRELLVGDVDKRVSKFLHTLKDPRAGYLEVLCVDRHGVVIAASSGDWLGRNLSATNQNLPEAIAAKHFRGDLYYRLNTFEIPLLPLRQRADDIAVLAPLLLDRSAREIGKEQLRLSDGALALLRDYDWPGNVRELRNLMERAAVLSTETVITEQFVHAIVPARLAGDVHGPKSSTEPTEADNLPLSEAVDRFERHRILRALDDTGDNKTEAARRLGISERNLWYKLKKHGL